jgi:hypothetical protein
LVDNEAHEFHGFVVDTKSLPKSLRTLCPSEVLMPGLAARFILECVTGIGLMVHRASGVIKFVNVIDEVIKHVVEAPAADLY